MNYRYLALAVMLGALVFVVMSQYSSDSVQPTRSEFQIASAISQTASSEDVAAIHTLMTQFRTAAHTEDIEGIVALFSNDFKSEDATGKDGVRELWTMIIDFGFASKLKVNMETAVVEVNGDEAAITVFDDEGDTELAFFLERGGDSGWLITGSPPEDATIDYNVYREPHGDECVQHGDFYRCWNIAVPEINSNSMALVIDLHGFGDSVAGQRRMSGFESLGASEGFILAWPIGIGKSWNAGGACCGAALGDGIDDVGFLRKLVDEISGNYAVDASKVYVTGLSNGCAMTQRLAAEASDIVAAAACMSLHLLVPPPDNYTPVPVMVLYGTNDRDIYEPSSGDIPTARENIENWVRINHCSEPAVETSAPGGVSITTYRDCDAGSEVSMVAIDGAVHILYEGMQTDVDTTQIAWDFLKRF